MMGGAIGVISQVNAGSTFWFRLPLKKQTGPRPTHRVTPSELEGLRILAVDDNPTNREILFRQLSAWHFRAETAPDAPTAFEMLRRAAARGRSFAAAIVDGEMPRVSGFELAEQIQSDEQLKATPLVMLSSLSAPPPGVDIEKLGIAGCLTKPVRQSQLFDTLVEATTDYRRNRKSKGTTETNRKFQKPKEFDSTVSRMHSISGQLPARARLLLAEDNEINRMVALEILERFNFQCDVATTGRQVIECLLRQPYDVVLMDCQMPELDGLAAPREIRKLESEGALESRGCRVPIVALTANAIEGDREVCLAAGMDDYLTKPLDSMKLIGLLEAMLKVESAAEIKECAGGLSPQQAPSQEPEFCEPPFNLELLLGRCLGNHGFVHRMLGKLAERLLNDILQLKITLAAGQIDKATPLAHALKGVAANLSAEPLRRAAEHLETVCRGSDAIKADQCLAVVGLEADRCLEYLSQEPLATAETT
jgi:Amt family ammonium transporter